MAGGTSRFSSDPAHIFKNYSPFIFKAPFENKTLKWKKILCLFQQLSEIIPQLNVTWAGTEHLTFRS